MPFSGPRDDQYDPDEIPLPETFYSPPGRERPLKTRLFERAYAAQGSHGLPLRTEAEWRCLVAN